MNTALESKNKQVPDRWMEITIKDQCMSQAVSIVEDGEPEVLHDDIGNVEDLVYGLDCDDDDDTIRRAILRRITDDPADYTITIVRG